MCFANNRSEHKSLRCNTFIGMMKTTELGNGNDSPELWNLPRKRTLLAKAQVGSRLVVVAEVTRQPSLEMARVQNDKVVQTLSANRADEPLGIWILPGTLKCCQDFLDTSDWMRNRTLLP